MKNGKSHTSGVPRHSIRDANGAKTPDKRAALMSEPFKAQGKLKLRPPKNLSCWAGR
jgi:hypothetical protein